MEYLNAFAKADPDAYELSLRETARQVENIRLIPSENYVSQAVAEAGMTVFNNKYAEGYPDLRYYQGTRIIDELENLVNGRLKALFNMPHANCQPYSGSPANLAAYMALLDPGDAILGMHLPSGGHLTHGAGVSATGRLFKAHYYGWDPEKGITGLDPETGLLDYDEIRRIAEKVRPRMIVCGASSYPRIIDFARFAEIARSVGAFLMADIAHINGLIIGGVHPSPAGSADVVTSTSHKLLRGPRGAFILSDDRKAMIRGKEKSMARAIDFSVFPHLQGGPHYSAVAALAAALKEAASDDYRAYAKNVVENAAALAEELKNRGFHVVTGGTENHLLLVDVYKSFGHTGKEFAEALEKCGVVVNFNTIPGDPRPPQNPSGIRMGAPAVTTRGFTREDMTFIAEIMEAVAQDFSGANFPKLREKTAQFCHQDRLGIPGVPAETLEEIKKAGYWKKEFPYN